jgi:hypothetical protein
METSNEKTFVIDELEAEVVYDALPDYLKFLRAWVETGNDDAGWGRSCIQTGEQLYLRLREFRFPAEEEPLKDDNPVERGNGN